MHMSHLSKKVMIQMSFYEELEKVLDQFLTTERKLC